MAMNFLDKIIGAIDPKAGAERAAWRAEMELRAHYDAADSGRLQSRWTVTNQPAEIENEFDRDIVRARARDQERNSDVFNSITRAFRRNVVGPGIHVRVTAKDKATAAELERLWALWCKPRNCDVTGTQSLNQMIRMCVQRKVIDGGVLILKRYTRQGILPFQLQVLEVDDLDTTQMSPKAKGNRIVGGIELNSWNRPVGYWIRQCTPDGYGILPSVYVEAKDVIYYRSKMRPTQIREMSDMAPTITRVKDINEYMNAAIVKEKIAASLAVFIKKLNPATGTFGSRNQGGGAQDIMYAGKRIVPGMIMEMNPGDEAQFLEPKSQGTDATTFVKLQQRMVSASQGLSYEATSRDMSETTYSSARQGLIEDDLTYGEEREAFEDIVLDEIYETFVISCWLAGKITPKDFWDRKDEYMSHEWIVEPRQWIDPYREANANKIALETGQKTFQQICSENGRDWKKVIDEIAEANEYAKKKGIQLSKVVYDEDSIDPPEEKDAQEEDEEGANTEDGNDESAEEGANAQKSDGAE